MDIFNVGIEECSECGGGNYKRLAIPYWESPKLIGHILQGCDCENANGTLESCGFLPSLVKYLFESTIRVFNAVSPDIKWDLAVKDADLLNPENDRVACRNGDCRVSNHFGDFLEPARDRDLDKLIHFGPDNPRVGSVSKGSDHILKFLLAELGLVREVCKALVEYVD